MPHDPFVSLAPDALALPNPGAVEATHGPHPMRLSLAGLEIRRRKIHSMVTRQQVGGKNRPSLFRKLLPTGLRRLIGALHPEMASEVARAALELGPKEQAEWMSDVLTPYTLDRLAYAGSAQTIGKLALTISISKLEPNDRAKHLGMLLNPDAEVCQAVADSLDPRAISDTAYAMASCLPVGSEEWVKPFQNLLLSDACVKAVATSNDKNFLVCTVLAAEQLPDKARRTKVLQDLLTENNRSMLKAHASTHPHLLAFAVHAAQQLPVKDCQHMLQDLMSPQAISAALRDQDAVSIVSLVRGAWQLQSQSFLSQLVTPDTCHLVRELNDAGATELMRDAARQLPEGPLRQGALQALETAPPWQRFLDARSDPPTPLRERTPSPGGI
jgi:hypothetical protein